jgi:DNA-binding IclR family transcriptional regulator
MCHTAAMKTLKTPDSSALTHGLEILRLLAEANGPITATDIASKVGLHQSSVSRILQTLRATGYVRKPAYHRFGIDLGVLTLGGSASRHFKFIHQVLPTLQQIAETTEGLQVTLSTVWQSQLIYFARTQHGHEAILFNIGGFPLHLSSPALSLLLNQPQKIALGALHLSRQRYGWSRPTPSVPRTSEAVLKAARKLLVHDCLILDQWQNKNHVSASVCCDTKSLDSKWPLALSISGPIQSLSKEQLCLQLTHGRRLVESVFRK